MAKNTPNYEFEKPEQNDFYDVDVQNRNWDKAETALTEFDDAGSVDEIKSFPDFLKKFVTGNKLAVTMRNLKAGLQFVLHAGQIVNNCVTDNAGLPLSAAQGKALMDKYTQLYSDSQALANNLSKRFAINNTENAYNALSDLPETGSGFGTTTTGLTLYDGFKIPAYSRICFMNYGGSKDGAIFAIDGDGKAYTAFRNNGTWHRGNSLVSKDDLSNYWSLTSHISIGEKADMNSFMTPGNYSCDANTTVKTLLNCPLTQAFLMKVYYPINGGNYIIQEYTPNDGGLIVRRVYDGYSKTWTMKKVVFS